MQVDPRQESRPDRTRIAGHVARRLVVMLAVVFALAGCSDETPPDPVAQGGGERSTNDQASPSVDAAAIPDPITTPSDGAAEVESSAALAADESEKPTWSDAFRAALDELDDLRDRAQFGAGLTRIAQLRQDFTATAESAELRYREGFLRRARREALELQDAIDRLNAPEMAVRQVARQQLSGDSEVVRIMLRHVLREAPDNGAMEASGLLAERNDGPATKIIAQRLLTAPTQAVREAFAEDLNRLVDHLDPADARQLFVVTRGDADFSRRSIVGVLGAWIEHRFDGEGEAFDQAIERPDAYIELSDYVQRAIRSGSESSELRAWATSQADRFAVTAPGLRGSYYAGASFNELLFDRIDTRLEFLRRDRFGLPDRRVEYFSVRWTGRLRVGTGGEYAIRISSNDGHRVYLNDEVISDAWEAPAAHQRVMITLEPGLHDLKVEYRQTVDDAYFRMSWAPPFSQERVLDEDVLSIGGGRSAGADQAAQATAPGQD